MKDWWPQLVAVFNTLYAGFLAALPGIDREYRNRAAGLRTYMVVGMSTAMLTSMALFVLPKDAASRLVANLVTGIGFLGAGVIFRRSHGPTDLTTAASVWMVALIGIVVAYQFYLLATMATVFLLVVLSVIRRLELNFFGEKKSRLVMSESDVASAQDEEE